jgi:adenylate cyclase
MFKHFKYSLLVLFATLTLIVAVSITVSSYSNSKDAVIKMSNEYLEESTRYVMDVSRSLLQQVERDLHLAAVRLQSEDLSANRQAVSDYLFTLNQQSPYYSSVYVANRKGALIQAMKSPNSGVRIIDSANKHQEQLFYQNADNQRLASMKKATDYNPLERPWYLMTKASPQTYWSGVYPFSFQQEKGLTASYPLLKNGQVLGVVAIDISLTKLSDFISDQTISKKGKGAILLLNEKAEIVAMPNKLLSYKKERDHLNVMAITNLQEEWIKACYQKMRDLESVENKGHERYLIETDQGRYFVKLSAYEDDFYYRWSLLTVIPAKDVFHDIKQRLYDSIAIAVVLTILALVFVYMISFKMSKPVLDIYENARLLMKFRFDEIDKSNPSSFEELKFMQEGVVNTSHTLKLLRRYAPAELFPQVLEQSVGEYKVGLKTQEMMLFSASLEGFSHWTDDKQRADYLLRYQQECNRVLLYKKACIDHYADDRLLAFWLNDTQTQKQQVVSLCEAALACQQSLLTVNRGLQQQGKSSVCPHIGLHVGEAMVGNMGSTERMQYSVFGQQVEVCRQLGAINARYGSSIILSETLYQQIKSQFFCRLLDEVILDGIEGGVYELISAYDDSVTISAERYVEDYEKAVGYKCDEQPDKALDVLQTLAKTRPQDTAVQYLIHSLQQDS